MADDKIKRGPADSSKINMSEDYEVRCWTETFGCIKEQLATAVKKFGSSAKAVEAELADDQAGAGVDRGRCGSCRTKPRLSL